MVAGAIRRHVLSDGDVSVTILNLGCITQDWQVPLGGQRVPVLLGYRDPAAYLDNPFFMGAIVGRVANRTAAARFELDGRVYQLDANDGPHHLHGGAEGLHRQLWQMESDGPRAVCLRHRSPSGWMGYPGAVDFEVTITLSGFSLIYEMTARTDVSTPVNLAQHSYYALTGGAEIWDQTVRISADHITGLSHDLIATGSIDSLDGHPLDLRHPRLFGEVDPLRGGIDINYALAQPPTPSSPGGGAGRPHA